MIDPKQVKKRALELYKIRKVAKNSANGPLCDNLKEFPSDQINVLCEALCEAVNDQLMPFRKIGGV